MVQLGAVLLRQAQRRWSVSTPSPLVRGPESVRDLLPYTVVNRKKEYVRTAAPGFKRTYRSVVMGRDIQVRATLGLQRKIDQLGGFDRYIFYSPPEQFKSRLAQVLKQRMTDLVAKYPSARPPPFDKRNPKPLPKKLSVNIPAVEVGDMTHYVYLG